MKLTPSEWEIINHRLGAPDAIAECLVGSEGFYYSHEQTVDRAMAIESPDDIDWSSELDREIIQDCCLGCTLFGDMEDAVALGEVTKGWAMAMHKAAKSLEVKTGAMVTR